MAPFALIAGLGAPVSCTSVVSMGAGLRLLVTELTAWPRHGCPATNRTNRRLAAGSERRCFTAAGCNAQLRPRSQSPGCRVRREGVSALSVRLGGKGGSGDAVARAPAPPAAAGQSDGGGAALVSGVAAAADPEDGYAVDAERDSGAGGDDMPPGCARPRTCCARAQLRHVGEPGGAGCTAHDARITLDLCRGSPLQPCGWRKGMGRGHVPAVLSGGLEPQRGPA